MRIDRKLELMKTMFNPRNVALVGGTDNIMKIGAFAVINIRSCGYTKNAYVINPNQIMARIVELLHLEALTHSKLRHPQGDGYSRLIFLSNRGSASRKG